VSRPPVAHTHLAIDAARVGAAVEIEPGRRAVARLRLRPEMAADERGLVHGGFVFGLADYAAMLAVDEPWVVLAGAEVSFVAPAVVGQTLEAVAEVETVEGRRRRVRVRVARGADEILHGTFRCVVPEAHVLDRAARAARPAR
jgi:acyl-coenzyme A thioesterase PaaI-like protein